MQALRRAGVEAAEAEAWTMLEAASGTPRLTWLSDPRHTLSPAAEATLAGWLARRSAGEPLQHLLGEAWFYGRALWASPAAMIPRPETEMLVEAVLRELTGCVAPLLLDVGSGSGAIAVTVALERPGAQVHGSDVSRSALELAARNAERHGAQVHWHHADLLEAAALQALLPRLAVLVANLPYLPDDDAHTLPPEVRRDPPAALFGGPDGLTVVRRLLLQALAPEPDAGATARLNPGAVVWLEVDPRNVVVLAEWLQALPPVRRDGRAVSVHADLVGRDRFVRLGPVERPATPQRQR